MDEHDESNQSKGSNHPVEQEKYAWMNQAKVETKKNEPVIKPTWRQISDSREKYSVMAINKLYFECERSKLELRKLLLILKEMQELAGVKKYYTSAEVKVILKISRNTLQRYRNESLLPYIDCKGTYRYKHEDIIKLMATKTR